MSRWRPAAPSGGPACFAQWGSRGRVPVEGLRSSGQRGPRALTPTHFKDGKGQSEGQGHFPGCTSTTQPGPGPGLRLGWGFPGSYLLLLTAAHLSWQRTRVGGTPRRVHCQIGRGNRWPQLCPPGPQGAQSLDPRPTSPWPSCPQAPPRIPPALLLLLMNFLGHLAQSVCLSSPPYTLPSALQPQAHWSSFCPCRHPRPVPSVFPLHQPFVLPNIPP